VTHPILTFEEDLRNYVKALPRAILQWLLYNRPIRAAFQGLMFSKPAADAEAQLFTFNGFSFGTRFFGMVRTQPVEIKKPEPKRIITA